MTIVFYFSKEDVEKCKQKDLLEEMLKEMTGEFPALSKVFVQERDTFLANSLHMAAQPIPNAESPNGNYYRKQYITKMCPCNVYPLEPHFYIAKLGYAGVSLFFLQNIDCGYSLEPPCQ